MSELGFDPSTLGLEGQHLASELWRQIRCRLDFLLNYPANRVALIGVELMRPSSCMSRDVETLAPSIYWKPEALGLYFSDALMA